MRIVFAGLGYVGLTNAVLLAQNNTVIAADIDSARVELVNARQSPIADPELEEFQKNQELDLSATSDAQHAYSRADYVIVATPTNYDLRTDFFDTASVEAVIEQVIAFNPSAVIVIKSTIPMGFVEQARVKFATDNIIFRRSFCAKAGLFMTICTPRELLSVRDQSGPRYLPICFYRARRRRTCPYSSRIRKRPKRSNSLPIATWPWGLDFLMSSTAMLWRGTYRHVRSLMAFASIRVSVTIITIHLLAMVDIACQRTVNNCLPILLRYRKISFKQL